MLELEPMHGLRVVADPAALDRASWRSDRDVTVLRLAADDAFAVGARSVEIDDGDAIIESEAGFVGAWLTAEEFEAWVLPRIEWPLPADRPTVAQGSIAGVPSKLWLRATGGALLLVPTPFADELATRNVDVYLLDGTATPSLTSLLAGRDVAISGTFDSMASAVDAASAKAQAGDIVALCPACASFGMFRNEFDRGEQFRRAVLAILAHQ